MNEIPNYDVHAMKTQEYVIVIVLAMGFLFLVGFIFYEHMIIAGILSLFGILYIPIRKKEQVKKRKEVLVMQFKDALYFLSVSLSAGKSLEIAFMDAQRSLANIYPDGSSDMVNELGIINHKLSINISVEEAVEDFAARAKIDDIKSFADVLSISKRAGANLIEVIKNTTMTLREKIEVRHEIENIIAGKKLEQKILAVMPFALVLFIKTTSSEFLLPLYATLAGRAIMTAALGLIAFGYFVSVKIMRIEV